LRGPLSPDDEPQRWNDGDSFHVILPDRKEVIFRLYFMDTPEEERVYADRIAEQADFVLFLHPKPEVVYLVVANRFTGACSKANPAEGVVRFGQLGIEDGSSVD
jgi:endonuclease YncB( thermonuclease family)